MGTSYLVEGAKLRCMCGSKCSELKVTDHGYYADGKKKANCKDCLPEINILDFGTCKKNKNGKVCKGFMKLADKWENLGDASRLEKLSGHAALTMDSVLLCKKGGLIVPETSGQGEVREINWGLFLTRYGIKQAFAALGIKEGCLYGRDPVNLNTGNFLYEKEDLAILGITKMSFHIFYNSMDGNCGSLGMGWHHNYEIWVRQEGDGTVCLHFGDGRRNICRRSIGNVYTPVFGGMGLLRKEPEGYRYAAGEMEYVFDRDGLIRTITDRNGNMDTFTYNAQGQLEEARGANGGVLHYYYNQEGNLYRVCDHTGREVRLGYSYGVLRKFQNSMGYVYTYSYNENGRLESVTTPRGIEGVKNTYDAADRVLKQETPDGGVVEFRYDDKGMCTYERDQNGHIVSYESDDRFRNVRTVYRDGEEHFAYNDSDRRTLYVDRNGNRTKYSYDEKGNLTGIKDALGHVTEFSYDSRNRMISITAEGKLLGKNRYDGKGRLVETSDALGRSRKTAYGENGLPERITMPDGSSTLLRYDERGNIQSITDPYGNVTSYVYDGLNRVTESTDAEGNVIRYSYNELNRLTCVVNQEGNARKYTYNESGRPVAVEDFDGGTLSVVYNAMGKPEKLTDKEGRETLRYYGRNGNISREVSPSGAVSDFFYDGNDRLGRVELRNRQEEEEAATVITYEYDPAGNLVRTGMGDGSNIFSGTAYSYDALNRMTEAEDPAGGRTVYAYDRMGNVSSITDAAGNRRMFRYNAAGERTEETDIRGNITRYEYDVMGKVTAVTDGAGRTVRYFYQKGGRLEKAVYPDGRQVSYEYDRLGRVRSRTDGQGYRLDYEYDCMGRLISITGSDGQKKTYTYDAAGNVASMADAGGNTTFYEYTLSGRLKAVTDALGSRTEYDYDNGNRLVRVCRKGQAGEEDRETFYDRNPLGQVECIRDALGGEEHYAYDALGRMILKTDRDGYRTAYGYEPDGKVKSILYGDGTGVEMEYTALRQLSAVRDWMGETRIERDAFGKPVAVTDHKGRTVSYEWGSMGERKSVAYPDGAKVSYCYDGLLRLEKMGIEGIGRTGMPEEILYRYDGEGRLAEKEFPGGMRTLWHYDGYGRLEELVHEDRDGMLDRFRYEYDPTGNRTAIVKERRGIRQETGRFEYTYDGLCRLKSVIKDGNYIRCYSYDSFGNRNSMENFMNGTNVSYTYDTLNRLIAVDEMHGEKSFSTGHLRTEYMYDNRGNMVGENREDELFYSYVFDAKNRLAVVLDGIGNEASYAYNGLGQRVEKSVNGKKEEYILDLTKAYNNLLGVDKSGCRQNFYFDEKAAAMEIAWNEEADWDRKGRRAFTGLHYYFHDELGSTLRVSGYREGKTAIGRNRYLVYGYDEFGNDMYHEAEGLRASNGYDEQGVEQPFGYTGYRYERISRAYFAQTREYLSVYGRFNKEDSIRQGANWYLYCNANPLRYVDPLGLDAILINKKVDNEIAGKGLGIEHMGAFFQDENDDWYFFFWGDHVEYEKIEDPNIFGDMDSMNEYLYEHELYDLEENPYIDTVYIKGDFTESHVNATTLRDEYRNIVKTTHNEYNEQYDFFRRNCGQVTMNLFEEGILPSGMKVGDYLTYNGYGSTVLPNVNMANMQRIFYNSSLNVEGFDKAVQELYDKCNEHPLLYYVQKMNLDIISGCTE